MSVYYLDYISGSDSVTDTPLGWWSVSVTVTGGSSPVAGDKMTGGTSGKVAYLTITPSAWTGSVTCYFYGRSGAFVSENVTFGTEGGGPGTGTGSIGADLTYCAWKTITSGPTAARIGPGDTIRMRGGIGNRHETDTTVLDGTPQSLGSGTWTDNSATVTLSSNTDTTNIEMCDATGTGNNQWSATPIANVTVTTNTTVAKEGSTPTSIITTIGASFGTGRCSWANFASLNLSGYQGISFWIRSSVAVTANYLKIDLCNDTGTHGNPGTPPASPIDTFTIPFKLEANRYYPVSLMKDGGGNLGGAITSIALNVATDYGAGVIYLDNIIAIKSNGLSLQSLISRNVTGETWWAIKSINSTTIILGEGQQGGTDVTKYYVQPTDSSPVVATTYRRETIKTILATASTTQIQTFQDAGNYNNKITYTGGWNIDTNTRPACGTGNEETWFDGMASYGYGLIGQVRYVVLENVGLARYYNSFNAGTLPDLVINNLKMSSAAQYAFQEARSGTYTNLHIVQTTTSGGGVATGTCGSAVFDSLIVSSSAWGFMTTCGNPIIRNGLFYGNSSADFYIVYGASVTTYNTKLLSTNTLTTNTSYIGCQSLNRNGVLRSIRENGTANNHKTRVLNGRETNTYYTISYDTTIYRTASPSTRIAPNSSTFKAESAPADEGLKIPVASGATRTIHVWIRKSYTGGGDSASYNGNQPRLIVRRYDDVGYSADSVLDTATGSVDGNWEELTGTTSAATNAGVFEFIVDCDGTAGWLNVDDWTYA